MKGTRPLDNDEIRLVSACFTGTYQARNRGLFMLGVSTVGVYLIRQPYILHEMSDIFLLTLKTRHDLLCTKETQQCALPFFSRYSFVLLLCPPLPN